ncbi:MAG: aldolase [Alphaproteobacteria bacterium]|nr:aldolase [Alphaproteobacteria bacterium]
MNTSLRRLRVDLAAAYRLAVMHGLHEGICNHFTLAVPGHDDRFLVIPYGLHWSEVTASNLIVADDQGATVEGDGAVEGTALFIHGPVHRARPDARCVLHTHMPYATALTSLADGHLPMATQNAFGFHGRIAYDDDYCGLALDAAEGERLARVLGDRDVLMMANHGVLALGATVAEAYDTLYYLERACLVTVLALSTGRPLKVLPERQVARVAAQMQAGGHERDTHFEALKRLLDRSQPDYVN